MFGSWVLEVVIGLVFVFLLFSTICAAVREGIEAWTKTRAAYLERGLREMLHDMGGGGLAREFYEHPLVYSLYAAGKYTPGDTGDKLRTFARGGDLPSYIPAKNFAAAMIDIAARGPLPSLTPGTGTGTAAPALSTAPVTAQSLRAGIATMENKRVARALLNALDLAQDDLTSMRLNLEAWYDAGMDRVSGWYKRSTQWIVFWLALAMAVALNVDTIGIANFLYQNDNARRAVVVEAEKAVARARQEGQAPAAADALTTKQKYDLPKATLDALDLPIGWDSGVLRCHVKEDGGHCAMRGLLTVIGWLLTALAATLGAPFWFDTLNKVVVIRSTVKPYEKSKPEGSDDRQSADQSLALAPVLRQLAGVNAPGGVGAQMVASQAAAAAVAATAATAAAAGAAAPPDNEAAIDSCEPGDDPVTLDDELPPADGGVLR